MIISTSETMPAILEMSSEKIWLDKTSSESDLLKLLLPTKDDEIDSYTISPQIYQTANDRPSLILPAPPADQFGNLTLFD